MRFFSVITAFCVGTFLGASFHWVSGPAEDTPESAAQADDARFSNAGAKGQSGDGRLAAIGSYTNLDYGFQMAVPAGWRRIAMPQAQSGSDLHDLGFAVGFELSRQGKSDQFADYILVEILPGDDSGLFDASPAERYSLDVSGEVLGFDKLLIDSSQDKLAPVDLLVFQSEYRALGYTIDFYAIGEPHNQEILFDAFQLILRTYKQLQSPFTMG